MAGGTLLALLVGLGAPPLLKAENMRSDSFIIQFGNFNTTSGEKSSSSYTVTDTVGQNAPGQFSGTGYTVLSGFQYIYGLPRFSFRILGLHVDLGELTAGTFSSNTNQLVITTRSGGYSILSAADHKLRQAGGTSEPAISHTSCDTACTISSAGIWSGVTNFGFGFNIAGTHRSTDFIDSTYFRPFADRELAQSPQTIAQHNAVVRDDVLTVTYKAAISATQASGQYTTAIDYIAVPTY